MKSENALQEDQTGEATELARVRAEVAGALSQRSPNEAQLTAALDQVDKLIDEAREELTRAVHELQALMNIEAPVRSSEDQATPSVFRGSGFFFPW